MHSYQCFYCENHAKQKMAIICCPELKPSWGKNADPAHLCGEEKKSSGEIDRFNQCTNTATDVLYTSNGTPEIRFRPVDLGWLDPTKSTAI